MRRQDYSLEELNVLFQKYQDKVTKLHIKIDLVEERLVTLENELEKLLLTVGALEETIREISRRV